MERSAPRIIVADDHPIFREGVCGLLTDGDPQARVEQAGTYDEMVALARLWVAPNLFVPD